jgi:hypothetical protein
LSGALMAHDAGYKWMRTHLHPCAAIAAGIWLASAALCQPLPPAVQALLERARAASPSRYQFALDQGARILPSSDGRSFSLLWYPAGAAGQNAPLVATLHGTSGWAFDEFFLWREQAAGFGYGILALQWWFGEGEGGDAYYSPADLHRELRAVLRQQGNLEGTALLHGFSRGASNIYGVAALDSSSGDRFYGIVLANSGGASSDFPPNAAIARGEQGYNVFSGSYWSMFCGGADPNPDRDGCPAMRRTAEWVNLYGGVVDLFIEDARAGHGGFHQSTEHVRSVLDAFRRTLELRAAAPSSRTIWQVRRDADFEIPNAGIPNVGWVKGGVWLVVGGSNGPRLYRSPDGSNGTSAEVLNGLGNTLAGSGYSPGEVVPRKAPAAIPFSMCWASVHGVKIGPSCFVWRRLRRAPSRQVRPLLYTREGRAIRNFSASRMSRPPAEAGCG